MKNTSGINTTANVNVSDFKPLVLLSAEGVKQKHILKVNKGPLLTKMALTNVQWLASK